jgi:hypothetical protein
MLDGVSHLCHTGIEKVPRPAGLGTVRHERSEWRRFPKPGERSFSRSEKRARQDSNLRPPA